MSHGWSQDLVAPCLFAVNEEAVLQFGLVGGRWGADTQSAELRVSVGHVPRMNQ